ncbi:FtsB family cell division protein [Pedobacter flavus]|uniref:Septum formation initiator family protein n=1 Tax=Pedobacter flavus TaxID=3113906 RepID=A0ABU7H1B2_9SPHI|nr:septum formation initiator family protein [Pedobacter sp. VNH31]MEE1884950.1 septum formation initiator family protein [Pedobacter sp. VNH31]
MSKLLQLFKNKYFVTTFAFVVWMLFFDKNDVLSQYEYRSEVKKLETEKEFYSREIEIIKKDLNELGSNLNTAEKFAREKYFMKKDNEDVFVIIKEQPKAE